MSILEARGLTVRYGAGARALTAVEDVDLALQRGRTLGLVGESGCGKSTVARALVGLVPIVAGRVTLDGADCTSQAARNSARYRRRVQMVFQDPFSSLNPRMSVGTLLDEALQARGGEFRSRRRRMAESAHLLELVGLPSDALSRYPHQFSGGQRQRIAIGRALAVGADVLILDEVTSALDVSVQATVLNLLQDLQRHLSLSYLFISHDLSVVRLMSDEVLVMYLGRVVEHADTEDLFTRPCHPYTVALLKSIPSLRGRREPAPLSGDPPDPRHPPAGCRFHTRCPVGPLARPERTRCLELHPRLAPEAGHHQVACHFAEASPR
ncbi:MAG TPA: ABC transporter ATP-binding protein [Candidatus Dormibacteraeota bacterium]|nr:ABC transporter ATP-binding protein [Candidatus Dormibacteraeota bacterium]